VSVHFSTAKGKSEGKSVSVHFSTANRTDTDFFDTDFFEAIASHRVRDRPGRVEPRANKRRPEPQRFLNEPRAEARKRLMDKV